MANYWFKRKTYGWGWTPANSTGWLVVLIFFLLMGTYPLLSSMKVIHFSRTAFTVIDGGLAVLLAVVCFVKGEPPRWSWGKKN